MDPPDEETPNAILRLCIAKFVVGLEAIAAAPLSDWTGAEIKTLCRVVKMPGTSLEQEAHFVVPLCRTAKEKIQALRE